MENITYLPEENYLGRGAHRKCYIHPTEPQKCIKVNYNVGADIETNREIKYYKHLTERNITWDSLSRYYGTVETNLGMGHIYDLIRDENNSISTSLETYIQQKNLDQKQLNNLALALHNLKTSLCDNRIITMTIKSKNILYQQRSDGNRLVIIDNIGNARFVQIDSYCNWFAQRSIARKWQRFINTISKENSLVTHAYFDQNTK